jgi:hypothetical protein
MVLLFGFLVGCSEGPASQPFDDGGLDATADISPGPACADIDCPEGQACYRGTCYDACDSDAECGHEARCYDDQHCAPLDCSEVECDDQEECYRGVCYPSCHADADCADELACVDNACVDTCEEIDCPAEEVCYRGVCHDACDAQADCDDQSRCYSGSCVPEDCGGVTCRDDETCHFGACLDQCTSQSDCQGAAVCDNNACVSPSCDDGLQNGAETDVDCGGPDCPGCDEGGSCGVDDDCASGACEAGACAPADGCDATDCASSDGWVDDGAAYACCDGAQACSTCQDQEYVSHTCDGDVCTPEVTDTRTTKDDCVACGANEICDAGVCDPSCTCSGADDDCGCATCTDCTADDGWYATGASYACCDGSDGACTCQDEEYRSYSCSGTSCDFTVTDTRTQTSGCTTCNDGDTCTNSYCSGGSCQNDAYCDGTTSSCGCSSCADCSSQDGWYDAGSATSCCDGGQACSTCQPQEYRTYTCDGTSCTYTVTNTRTETSGCSTCNDGSSCTNSYCSGGTCQHVDYCSGTATDCGCASCTDCTTNNGWYNTTSPYACCDSGQSCTCVDQEYRSYSCSGTSCTYTVTNNRTHTESGSCSTCDDGDSCTNSYCSGGSCQHDAYCAGTTSSCGCTSCTSCPADGWYDSGASYACCSGNDAATCQDQEYRDYSCGGTSCTYTITNTRTNTSVTELCGTTCQSCSGGACVGGCDAGDICCGLGGGCQEGPVCEIQ